MANFFRLFYWHYIFFIKFPLYRYGYSYLISLLALIFLYFYKNNIRKKNIFYTFKFILILSIVIFFSKQSLRIIKSYKINYINKPWPRIYSFENNEKIDLEKNYLNGNFFYYLSKNGECMFSNPPCTNYKIDDKLIAKKIFGYTILAYR